MTTPRDLLITTLELSSSRPPGEGDLSLALAGAELIDLLNARAATLEDDRIVPGGNVPGETLPGWDGAASERLLNEASSSFTRQEPYETVEDWLWRRGRGLAAVYLTALRSEGQITQQRRSRWIPFGTSRLVVTDNPARRAALDRRTSDEPVLASLATAVGIGGRQLEDLPDPLVAADEPAAAVLVGVHNALRDLEAERQRRSIEQAAFDNIWRGE
ncbi:GPP34 family phosphoprotein [Streptomyces sp. NPDC051217]|uniref:GOLPH3/VPS74 family protein n=1 Tax=Streptomyces sp. NPDC051217 TaxID=3365644 RepID=UPI00378D566C